jgi:LacI family transcriptional regulator
VAPGRAERRRGGVLSGDQPRRKANRDDVARLAGTSTAVVSYVLNDGPRRVAPATRARVEGAIRQLGYRPDRVARALAARRSDTIGLIVSDISNPFIGDLSLAIETAAYGLGLTVLLANAGIDTDRERRSVEQLIDRRVDGLILVPVGLDAETVEELNRCGIPVSVIDRPVRGLHATTILANNTTGAAEVTAHLVEHGHRAIGCVAGRAPLPPASARLGGWSRAVQEAGLDPARCPVQRGPVSRQAGYEAAVSLLSGRTPPTAIFATSDEQAIGVLRAAADAGLKVPADLAVVGFDGIAQGAFCVPGLTTASQPVAAMGRHAVEAIADPSPGTNTTVFPVQLVRRGSCGCPDHLVPGPRPDSP